MRVHNHMIAETWEIKESEGEMRLHYPFMLVRTGASGHHVGFLCRTVEEAHNKLRTIADEYNRKGHVLAIA